MQEKQKCYAHHLRALSEAIERVSREGAEPLRDLKLLLRTAMMLDQLRPRMPEQVFRRRVENPQQSVYRILDEGYAAAGVEKALNRFRRHRKHLLAFLEHPEVEAANNLAEGQLGPAVIARKVSCGNKTESGKGTWQILAGIAATCRQQMRSFVDLVSQPMPLPATTPQLTAAQG